jgi:hypothetical protein
MRSDSIVDAIKELGQQIVERAKALEGCSVTQVHVLPSKQWQELTDACEGNVPFTFYHLGLYYQSYVGKYCIKESGDE